ncbi:MAG TPA: restriction endonuclease subunit S [Atopostipes sp.]|nr:restriction endonuclease subunit S [Atopostipes sp.]
MRFESDINMYLPRHWKIVKIEEIGEVVGGGTPSTRNPKYFGGEIAWITPKDLSGYDSKYISRGERNITELGFKNSSAKLMPKNTVLLSSRAPIGYVAIAANDISTNQGFKSVICDEEKINPEFLYYIFKISKRRLESVASGTTFKEVSGKKVKEFKIPLPPLNEQLSIISILNRLDKKIELNNSIISNLEELAQTLFKRWFVDFEFPNEEGKPYKSSGGKMVESELGVIPEGWDVGTVSDIAEVVMGQSPKSSTYNEEQRGIPLINGASDFKKDKIEPLKHTTDPKRLSQKGDYLFGVRATVGNVTYVDKEYALGRGVGVARVKDKKYGEYLYFHLINGINRLKYGATGSVYINFTRNDLTNMKLVMSSREIIELFHENTLSIFEEKHNLLKQSRVLENLRDTLLPKLLSGEIELPDDVEVTDDVPIS